VNAQRTIVEITWLSGHVIYTRSVDSLGSFIDLIDLIDPRKTEFYISSSISLVDKSSVLISNKVYLVYTW
jgi:hypothetical protein